PCDLIYPFLRQRGRAIAQVRPLGLDLLGEHLGREFPHQNLDTRLVLVVAPTVQVVDAKHGLEVAQQMLPGDRLANQASKYRRAAQAATDPHVESQSAAVGLYSLQADVVHTDSGTI